MDTLIPKVACYFTPDYEGRARELQESGRKFDVPVHAIPVPSTGYLQYFTLKPRRIQSQIESLEDGASFLCLDADNRFVDRPDWSEFENVDFGVHILKNGFPMGSAVFARNTSVCRSLIDKWIALTESAPLKPALDDYMLKKVMDESTSKGLKTNMPRWCYSTLLQKHFIGVQPIVVHDMIGTRARQNRR